MRKVLFLGLAFLGGGFVVKRLLRGEQRERLARLPASMMERCMERCMEMMPENSQVPPL